MKKTAGLNILVVAAHPDDEVLGCGATISKHVNCGDRVWVLILGQGITSRRSVSAPKQRLLVKKLVESAKSASRALGVERLILKKFPDNRFDSIPLLNIIQAIESVIEKFRPDVVYSHSSSDVNIDHRITIDAVSSAVRPLPDTNFKKILSFEIASSTEWNFIRMIFAPNFFINIDQKDFDNKLRALDCYDGETRSFPHPRSKEYLLNLAKVRGGQSGMALAEGFSVVYCKEE